MENNMYIVKARQGSFTIANIYDERGRHLATGVAKKHPCDEENTALGLELACCRALENYRASLALSDKH